MEDREILQKLENEFKAAVEKVDEYLDFLESLTEAEKEIFKDSSEVDEWSYFLGLREGFRIALNQVRRCLNAGSE